MRNINVTGPRNPIWNRLSAWSVAVTARLNEATNLALTKAFESFGGVVEETFTDEQKEEAYRLLITGVMQAMERFEVSLRPHQQDVETLCH